MTRLRLLRSPKTTKLRTWKEACSTWINTWLQASLGGVCELDFQHLNRATQVQLLLVLIRVKIRARRLDRTPTTIDPKIEPLVRAMNECGGGITTIASCHGHPGKDLPPHVGFSCLAETARKLDVLLDDLYLEPTRPLMKPWSVIRITKVENGQHFLLHSPSYHKASRSLIRSWLYFGIKRKAIDRDINAITGLLRNHFPPNNEISIATTKVQQSKENR